MTDLFCLRCQHHHKIYNDTLVCSERMCFCDKFTNAESLQLTEHQKMLDHLKAVQEKVAYMLENIPELRNLKNKSFVFAYWHYNHGFCTGMVLDVKTYYYLEDPENIRRAKQKLVNSDPDKYGPTDVMVEIAKGKKFGAVVEWVTTE